ncbi:MAG TPA: chitinase [Actinocrinis sp.]|uniref:chitinase n=1 Tax=Actinocrinis sp. TaxID=1920516 RepID=UPI002DDD14B1|nr:chitinase [Actinocrinis sp.]HEV2342863.1 chitinase [Actinocrinis sp.]
MRRFRAALAVAASGAMIGAAAIAVSATSAQAATALGNNWYASAPYDMPLDNTPPNLNTVMAATGEKAFELAFVLAQNNSSCAPAWDGGGSTVSGSDAVGSQISSLRSAGGDVSVSFGGYNGTKLGQVCGSASATASAEQQVINAYGLHAIDLDLEEPEYENSTAIANELGAAQILQRNNAGLYISVTIPGTAAGTGWFGTQLLDEAKTLGFTPNNYSIMPFDGGFSGASSQISALQAFNGILTSTFGWSAATAYAHEGVSSMNGRTDSAEYFYQADFQSVLNFAESNHLGRYTFWSVNRDRQCNPPNNNGTLSGSCSSVPQNDWDFTKYDAQFAGATPPQSPPPTSASPSPSASSTGGGTGGGTCATAWNSTTAYTAGMQVSYNGHNWTANQWNYNEVPGGASGAWNDNGAC